MSAHLREAWRRLVAKVEILENGSPLDYGHPITHRLTIYGPVAESTHPYFKDLDNNVVAFADVWVKSDEVYLAYTAVREDQMGKGYARELMQAIYDTWPDKGVDWGRMMSDKIVHLYQDFRKRYPDRGSWGKVRGKLAAGETVTLYHGTNQAALDEIRRDGQFERSTPEKVNREIEQRYGLPFDSVWRHRYNQFSHGRLSDPNVYFSQELSTAKEYASLGSEVIWDALNCAAHIIFDPFDEEGDYKPGKPQEMKAWIAAETAKHYKPVVLTVQVPFERVVEEGSLTTYEKWMSYGPQTTVRVEAPIPAAWITAVTPA